MADSNQQDYADSQPESNNYIQEECENLDNLAGSADYDERIPEQDEEVTTTNTLAGEEPAEEDRYAAGALESDAIHSSTNPLISWDDGEDFLSDQSSAVPESQFPAYDDDLGSFAPLASAGGQYEYSAPSPPPAATQDPYSNIPKEHGDEYITEPIRQEPPQPKPPGNLIEKLAPTPTIASSSTSSDAV